MVSEAKVIGILSIKGGVGKTSCTANIGAAIASQFGKKVLVVDTNYSAPNLGFHVGLLDPEATIHDVLSDRADIRDAIHEINENFHVIPASLVGRNIQHFKLKKALKGIKKDYDVILLDSSPNLNDEMLSTMIASDELYVVTSPDYPTLSTTMRAIKLALDKKTNIKGLILNRVRGKSFELSVRDIEGASGVPIVGVLPEDIKVLEALASTSPVSTYSPHAKAAIEFRKLGAFMVGEEYKDPRFLSKIFGRIKDLGFSKKDVPKEEVNKLLMKKKHEML
jgi:septum site-determining protein MinD